MGKGLAVGFEERIRKKRGFGFWGPTPPEIGGCTAGIWRTMAEEGVNENGEGWGRQTREGERGRRLGFLFMYVYIYLEKIPFKYPIVYP